MTHDGISETKGPQDQNDQSPTDRTLWDISTPEEVAHSIIGVYPDPLCELACRERFSRLQKNRASLRFWADVRQVIERALAGRPAS